MARRALWTALLLAVCAAGASALYEKGSPVIQLTHRSFDKVLESHVPTVVVSDASGPPGSPPALARCGASRSA